jgi:octopine/nopaline transport system substrate-binding protein
MKKIYMLIASLFLSPLSLFADWEEVRIGTEGAYPPWNGMNSAGQLEGAEIDMARVLCDRMGVKCSFVVQDWDGIIPALLNKKYDVIIAGMSITEERKEKVDFSRGYMTDGACIVVDGTSDLASFSPSKSSLNLDNSDDSTQAVLAEVVALLDGKSIGVQGSTIHENFVSNRLPNADLRSYSTQDDLNNDMVRLDAGIADCGAFDDFMAKSDGANLMSLPISMGGGEFGAGVGAAFRKDNDDLREMFDKAIDEASADGTLSMIATKWFGRDISM